MSAIAQRSGHTVLGLIVTLVGGLAFAASPAAAQPTCGQTITQNTTLTADLDCSSYDGYALTIGAPGITVDLGGHRLGSWQGILNQGHDDVTIRNGSILSELGSITLEGVERNIVRGIDTDGLLRGISVSDSDYNRFVDNRVTSVHFGFTRSDHNVIARNVITRWEAGLGLADSNHNRIVDNVIWVTTSSPFGIRNGAYNDVRRNTFITDLSYVVSLRGFNDGTFVDNRLVSQTGWIPAVGAEVENSSRNLFARNEFAAVPQGLRLHSGSSNVIRDNVLSGVPLPPGPRADWPDPVADGVVILAPATGTQVTRNSARGFDDDGIDVDAPGTRLKGNSATGNGDLGIEAVPGVVDQGGNTAAGNGNPLQCANVFCG